MILTPIVYAVGQVAHRVVPAVQEDRLLFHAYKQLCTGGGGGGVSGCSIVMRGMKTKRDLSSLPTYDDKVHG